MKNTKKYCAVDCGALLCMCIYISETFQNDPSAVCDAKKYLNSKLDEYHITDASLIKFPTVDALEEYKVKLAKSMMQNADRMYYGLVSEWFPVVKIFNCLYKPQKEQQMFSWLIKNKLNFIKDTSRINFVDSEWRTRNIASRADRALTWCMNRNAKGYQ